jgi:hypothetical protein
VIRVLHRLRQRLLAGHRWLLIQENDGRDLTEIEIAANIRGVYLVGYWQSEAYFARIQDLVRREFTFRHQPTGRNHELAEEIVETESVGVHVRRGDYVSNPRHKETYVTLGSDYYRVCATRVAAILTRPHFYVFSDEPAWAKAHLEIGYPATVVDHNGPGQDHEDLRLMSLCQHNIIANSSFSWWAAWLNANPEKRVMAPNQWFRVCGDEQFDRLPSDWMRV